MALFNITSGKIDDSPELLRQFMTSNMQINVATEQLRISELQITEQEWLGNL